MPRVVQATDVAVREAALLLRRGGVVTMPTETVYGLAADTFNAEAIARVFQLKDRPADNPLIAHVLDESQARRLAAHWDDRCRKLAEKFWPGPLTIVVRKARDVPAIATAGLETIAIRAPSHPVARRLLVAFGGPLSAPSANRSGAVSPTTAAHVAQDFAGMDDLLILDGGACAIGIESTVLELPDAIAARLRVLRPGGVTVESLRAVLGEVDAPWIEKQAAGPGTSPAHYAPRTPAELVAGEALASRLASRRESAAVLCFNQSGIASPHRAIVMPAEAEAYAAKLYDALREADALKMARMVIELPPRTDGLWAAIHDRLRRATARQREKP